VGVDLINLGIPLSREARLKKENYFESPNFRHMSEDFIWALKRIIRNRQNCFNWDHCSKMFLTP